MEICNVSWSADGNYLASGGNDNKLLLWSPKQSEAIARLTEHQAAIKALAWSPHHRNILASGGGTSDKTIKQWNVGSMQLLSSVNTGAQVCCLDFSKNTNEIVSTHGYNNNHIAIWSAPSMQKIATLHGHTKRVLYLA